MALQTLQLTALEYSSIQKNKIEATVQIRAINQVVAAASALTGTAKKEK